MHRSDEPDSNIFERADCWVGISRSRWEGWVWEKSGWLDVNLWRVQSEVMFLESVSWGS